jgi:hypothetical protein
MVSDGETIGMTMAIVATAITLSASTAAMSDTSHVARGETGRSGLAAP